MSILMFQGDIGSNSECASKALISKNKLLGITKLDPAISSINVVGGLKENKCKYGVVALHNSIGGMVKETREALLYFPYRILDFHSLSINHVFCVRNDHGNNPIERVYSHSQALIQCSMFLNENYSNSTIKSYSDTALAAKDLSLGNLERNTAILCSIQASKEYNLKIVHANISNSAINQTLFALIEIMK